MFAKQSMINRLSNPINRNRSAAKIPKVMSSTQHPISLSDHVAPLPVTVKRVRLAIVALALLLRCVLKLSMEDL